MKTLLKNILFITILLSLFLASASGYALTNQNKNNNDKPTNLTINVTGLSNDRFLIKNLSDQKIIEAVKSNLSILRYQSYALETLSHFRLFYNTIKNETKEALIQFGYFTPQITVSLNKTSLDWVINIHIKLNEQTTISQINITTTPKAQPWLEKQLNDIPLKKGTPLLQQNYLAAKTKILTTVNEAGYLDAVLDQSNILVNKSTHQAEVNFHITLGKRYRYGDIDITQKKYLFDKTFLTKFIPLRKGQIYDASQINKTQKQLDQSTYFASVAVVPDLQERNKKEGIIPIKIELIAKNSQSYSIGVGYGTFTGPRMTLGATYPHLSDTGHNAQLQLQLSSINTSFLAQYFIPGSDPVHTYWSLNAQQSLYDLIPYQALETLIGVNYIDNLTKQILINLGLHEYLIRYSTDVNSSTSSAKYLVPSLNVSYRLLYSDGYFDNGVMLSNLTQASPFIQSLSDERFVRNLSTLRIALPIYYKWTRFISSYNFGALSVDDINTIAPEFRFYAGGIGTLLGYAYLSQGPQIDGNLSGGRYLLTASAGIEQRIYGNFSSIFYYNVGNAFNQFNEIEPLHAAGVGLSWQSPLGPIVGYFTRTLNAGDEHWRFDFSIGTYF